MSVDPFDGVPRETLALLRDFSERVRRENLKQNLVSAASEADFWNRHIVDSAQLVHFMPATTRSWVDVGSGAGLPGLVIAILAPLDVTLLEPRAKRASFLIETAAGLGLTNVSVLPRTASAVTMVADVISARAVAPLSELVALTAHLAHAHTRWVLPKGKRWREELAAAREKWQGDFHAITSITSPEAAVIVASGITRRVAP